MYVCAGAYPAIRDMGIARDQRRIMYIHVWTYMSMACKGVVSLISHVVISRITKISYKDILLLAPSSKIPSQVSEPKKLLVFMLAFML